MRIWKDVFWFFTLLFVLLAVVMPFSASLSWLDTLILLISGITLIPLYGYAHQIPIGSERIAGMLFACNALLAAAGLAWCVHALLTDWGAGRILVTCLALLYAFVYLYPQYRYAFRSQQIWSAAG